MGQHDFVWEWQHAIIPTRAIRRAKLELRACVFPMIPQNPNCAKARLQEMLRGELSDHQVMTVHVRRFTLTYSVG